MKQLKRSFKLCARDVIEKSYINAANKLGWCNESKQDILNKSQLFKYIKSNCLCEEDLMRHLWMLQYERFRKEDSGLIQKFVNNYMKENNIQYKDDEDAKKKKSSGCMEVIAISIKTDINKQIRSITKERYKWIIKERHDNGGSRKRDRETSTEERFQQSIKRFPEYITQAQIYGDKDNYANKNYDTTESVDEKMQRLQKEIQDLQKQNQLLLNEKSTNTGTKSNANSADQIHHKLTDSSNKNKKKRSSPDLISNIQKSPVTLQDIPNVNMNNVHFNIESVGENACITFGSNILPSEDDAGKINIDKTKQREKNKKDTTINISKEEKSTSTDKCSECNHPKINELESPDYCKSGNELEGVFCNKCNKEFVHKYSNDQNKRKNQWKPGLGDNLVHACINCHECKLAYCNECWKEKSCNTTGRPKRRRTNK